MNITNHRLCVIAKCLLATNFRPARIKLSLPRFENKSIVIPFTDGSTLDSSIAYLESVGLNINQHGDIGAHYVLMVEFNQVDLIKKIFGLN